MFGLLSMSLDAERQAMRWAGVQMRKPWEGRGRSSHEKTAGPRLGVGSIV